jgi:hypothetical protein
MTLDNCLIKKCERGGGTRGLCSGCYLIARTMITRGETTEEVLVSKGMMLPKMAKSSSLFKEQFNT